MTKRVIDAMLYISGLLASRRYIGERKDRPSVPPPPGCCVEFEDGRQVTNPAQTASAKTQNRLE